MPGCPAPTDLRVESVTETSATLLWSLESEFEIAGYLLRYRAADVQVWDSVRDITAMQYNLTGLEPQTAYVWSVLSACADGRYSGWGIQSRFESEGAGNETGDPCLAAQGVVIGLGQADDQPSFESLRFGLGRAAASRAIRILRTFHLCNV